METYDTKYGKITLYGNEVYIGNVFKSGRYWDEDTFLKLKEHIDPDKNILEIGGHCGTSSILYATALKSGKVYVYEPQENMYRLLLKNIYQNNLQDKIIPVHSGMFCYDGYANMNDIDLDGGGGNVLKRYQEEIGLDCNFGGVCLGSKGERIKVAIMDSLNIPNIGFIHCDAQGSENFIFSKGIETVKRYKPVIFYENNYEYSKDFHNKVCEAYPCFLENAEFSIKKFCIENLGYRICIDRFNGEIDTLLIP